MSNKIAVLVSFFALASVSLAQRAGYAGFRPYGYPVIITTTTTTTPPPSGSALGDRFGNDVTTAPVTQRLPMEANGNVDLVNQLSKLPKDQQPFWLLNWQALEEHRNRPHTYPVQDNGFVDFASSGGNRQPQTFGGSFRRTMN